MRTSIYLVILLGGLLVISAPDVGLAQDCSGAFTSVVDKYREETRDAELKMLEAKQVLLSKSPEQWEDSDIETYQHWSLWVVYNGTMAYVLDGYRSVPYDLTAIEDQGYVLYWPENPFDDWKPMQVTDMTDKFLPGGLCIQIAPTDHRDGKGFAAFQLCVYGPDVDFGRLGNAEVLEMNDSWAIAPDGALYMLGMA